MQGGEGSSAGDGNPSERSSHGGGGDNWLPDGWTVEFKTRKGGNSKGKTYKCYVDSQGHKCYSKPQVFDYLKKIGRKEAHENTVPEGSIEIPWSLFRAVVMAVYQRKLLEETPGSESRKESLEAAEEVVRDTMRTEVNLPADWNYDPKTADRLVSRDGKGGLAYMSDNVEQLLHMKRDKKRSCCGQFSEEHNRRYMATARFEALENKRDLHVENFPFSTTELQLRQIFEKFGRVRRVYLPKSSKTGHCYGLAFVLFAKLEDAKAATQSLNGKHEIDGQIIKVCSFADHLAAQRSGEWQPIE